MIWLAQGELARAPGRHPADPPGRRADARGLEPGDVLGLFWILDEQQQQLLLRLPPSAFDDDRGAWGIALAGTYAFAATTSGPGRTPTRRRPRTRSRSRRRRTTRSSTSCSGPRSRTSGGRTRRSGRARAVELAPISKDAYGGAYNQHQLARIYILVGEPDKALDQLEPLLKIPYYLTPHGSGSTPRSIRCARIPRFQRLVAGTS